MITLEAGAGIEAAGETGILSNGGTPEITLKEGAYIQTTDKGKGIYVYGDEGSIILEEGASILTSGSGDGIDYYGAAGTITLNDASILATGEAYEDGYRGNGVFIQSGGGGPL